MVMPSEYCGVGKDGTPEICASTLVARLSCPVFFCQPSRPNAKERYATASPYLQAQDTMICQSLSASAGYNDLAVSICKCRSAQQGQCHPRRIRSRW